MLAAAKRIYREVMIAVPRGNFCALPYCVGAMFAVFECQRNADPEN
jgi:hypothetical protein